MHSKPHEALVDRFKCLVHSGAVTCQAHACLLGCSAGTGPWRGQPLYWQAVGAAALPWLCVQVCGMRHPLLLQRSLPRLPAPPVSAPADFDFETSHLDLAGEPGSSVDPSPVRARSDAEPAVQPPAMRSLSLS